MYNLIIQRDTRRPYWWQEKPMYIAIASAIILVAMLIALVVYHAAAWLGGIRDE